jgi:hypothetical protein
LARKDVLRPTSSDHESDNDLIVTENINISNRDFHCSGIDVNNVASDNNAESSCASSQVIIVFTNVNTNTADNSQITAGRLQDMLANIMATIQAELEKQRQENSNYMSKSGAKLGRVSADLDTKLNSVSEILNSRIMAVFTDMTAEMWKKNSKLEPD